MIEISPDPDTGPYKEQRNRVYTEQAIFDIRDDGLCVIETFGTTYADLQARLDVPLKSCAP